MNELDFNETDLVSGGMMPMWSQMVVKGMSSLAGGFQ